MVIKYFRIILWFSMLFFFFNAFSSKKKNPKTYCWMCLFTKMIIMGFVVVDLFFLAKVLPNRGEECIGDLLLLWMMDHDKPDRKVIFCWFSWLCREVIWMSWLFPSKSITQNAIKTNKQKKREIVENGMLWR